MVDNVFKGTLDNISRDKYVFMRLFSYDHPCQLISNPK